MLIADGVSVRFTTPSGGTVQALGKVDVEIPAGQFVAIVGTSGCGKTTLLNMFAGLVKPTAGRITVEDEPPKVGRFDVGYLFARDALLPWRSTLDNVALGLEAQGLGRSARHERAGQLLDLVGLTQFRSAYPRQLSQGMRQRAAIARTLAPEPRILLMDEPFAALDAHTKLHLQAEFLRIWEGAEPDRRQTVVWVTHDLQEALLLADRILVMLPRPGRIASDQLTNLPRPRAENLGSLLFSPEFREQHASLFSLLESDLAKPQPAPRQAPTPTDQRVGAVR
jgi:NitT/TauT family transport system ATP-binding protein